MFPSSILSNWKSLQTSLQPSEFQGPPGPADAVHTAYVYTLRNSHSARATAYESRISPVSTFRSVWEPDSLGTSWRLQDPGLLKAQPHTSPIVGIWRSRAGIMFCIVLLCLLSHQVVHGLNEDLVYAQNVIRFRWNLLICRPAAVQRRSHPAPFSIHAA